MNKITSGLSLIILIAWGPGCAPRKQIVRTKNFVDSTKVAARAAHVKNTGKDSAWHFFENRRTHGNSHFDLSIDRIRKTTREAPESRLLFRLNADAIPADGDTLTVTDIHTGAIARASKNKDTGEIEVEVNQKAGKISDWELSGLRLRTNRYISSEANAGHSGSVKLATTDSSTARRDSVAVRRDSETVQKTIKKEPGLLRFVGLIVIIAAILRAAIYLLRKQWPWVGWLNRILGGK